MPDTVRIGVVGTNTCHALPGRAAEGPLVSGLGAIG
ncbi:MAG: hypothetical protein JWN13_494 [Betaproteobacteria bacterium]|jgi:hypothetical protein|nr:hypothetical protein [Betaproteobacteria bacterium]